ncbi:fatty acid-binding protein DegV [Eubacterium sp. An11]|uniref:DegV family protein n=1 Tax=Eubacterium sp. An11 TaxID=1965542 RepID=UPI000B382BD6|nr:DegV family protein [Eubacterium sp. An11]OUQ68903.1 fatty acid-binding protein DegV [Eubacterium sp. An11]
MKPYILSCCSAADLSGKHFEQREIYYLCFHFEVGGTEYQDDMGVSMPPEELYRRMSAGEDTKTSQVSIGEYADHFERFLKEGKDILHVTLSSGISGTLNSARIAAEDLREKYPERKIYVVDSLAASSGYGLLMDELADRRDGGMDIDTLYQWVESRKLHLHHWFFSTDLTFFIRGGRISKASGFIGTMLNICPLMNVNHLGQLIPREKIRTKKKVIKRIVEKMEAHAENGTEYSGKCYICHSLCEADARAVASLVRERFPKLSGDVEIYPIGATIGSHTGPGTVALFFWGDERKD